MDEAEGDTDIFEKLVNLTSSKIRGEWSYAMKSIDVTFNHLMSLNLLEDMLDKVQRKPEDVKSPQW